MLNNSRVMNTAFTRRLMNDDSNNKDVMTRFRASTKANPLTPTRPTGIDAILWSDMQQLNGVFEVKVTLYQQLLRQLNGIPDLLNVITTRSPIRPLMFMS